MQVRTWVLVLASVFVTSGVFADTIQVTTLLDELVDGNGMCSLREAIATVNDASDEDAGSTGYVDCERQMDAVPMEGRRFTVLLDIPDANDLAPDVAEEVFALTLQEDPAPENEQGNAAGDLLIAAGVKIRLQGAGMDVTMLDAGGRDRHLFIEPGAEVELVQMTFRNGSAPANAEGFLRGGSVYFRDDTVGAIPLRIEACRFEDNRISNPDPDSIDDRGGAVYVSHVDVQNSEFLRNHALPDPDNIEVGGAGGALFVLGNMHVEGTLFEGNVARASSAILSNQLDDEATYQQILHSVFVGNYGSRLMTVSLGESGQRMKIEGNLFYQNRGTGSGGMVEISSNSDEVDGNYRIQQNIFAENEMFSRTLSQSSDFPTPVICQFNTFYRNEGKVFDGVPDHYMFYGNFVAQRLLSDGYDEGGERSCDELDFQSFGGNVFSQVGPGSPCLAAERFPDDVILPLEEVEAMVEEVEGEPGLVRPRFDSLLVDGVDCSAGLQYQAVEEDFLGTPRPQGFRCDIGAAERSADRFVVRVNRRRLPPTELCPLGVEEVTTGYDLDEDGVVDPSRVHTRVTGCVDPAHEMRTEIQAVPVTEDCPEGYLLLSGQDLNGSGALEEEEITLSQLRCFSEEAPGENCEFGGKRVEMGHDRGGDGEFDMEETEVTYLCNGGGEVRGIVEYEMLDATATCELGAMRKLLGVDENGDGTLNEEEVTQVLLDCKREATEEQCAHGGVRTEEGEDTNRDGVIDAAVLNQSLVCYPDPTSVLMPTGGNDGPGQSDGSAGDSGGCSCRVGASQNPANSLLVFAVGLYLIARTRKKRSVFSRLSVFLRTNQ